MSDPFAWNARTFGPSREQRAAAAERRGLPRRGYTYVANDGLTDRQWRKSLAVQAQERRRQQREQRRQVRIGDREDDRARRRARRDAGAVGEGMPPLEPPVSKGVFLTFVALGVLGVLVVEIDKERTRQRRERERWRWA